MSLRTAFSGNEDAVFTENGNDYPVRIWLDDFDRKNFEDVKNLSIINPMGIAIDVSQFADVTQNACGIIFMQHTFVGFPHI